MIETVQGITITATSVLLAKSAADAALIKPACLPLRKVVSDKRV